MLTAFLKGFGDSEGTIGERSIRFDSINKKGLEQVRGLLLKLGFTHCKVSNFKTSCYHLHIYHRQDLELFYNRVGFSIMKKQKKLRLLLRSYKRLRTYEVTHRSHGFNKAFPARS